MTSGQEMARITSEVERDSQCVVYVKDLRIGKVTTFLLEVNGNPISKKITLQFNINDIMYHEILNNLGEVSLLFTIKNAEVIDVKISGEYKIRDSCDVIKEILTANGNEMKKGDFYRLYTATVKCTERTALNHLNEAILNGTVESVGTHYIKLPNSQQTIVNEEE